MLIELNIVDMTCTCHNALQIAYIFPNGAYYYIHQGHYRIDVEGLGPMIEMSYAVLVFPASAAKPLKQVEKRFRRNPELQIIF